MTTVKLKLQEAAEFRDPHPMRLPGKNSMRTGTSPAAAEVHSRASPAEQKPTFQPAVMMSEPLVSPASTPTARLMTEAAAQHFLHSPSSPLGMGPVAMQPGSILSPSQQVPGVAQPQQAMPLGGRASRQSAAAQPSQHDMHQPVTWSQQAHAVAGRDQMLHATVQNPPQEPLRAQHLHRSQPWSTSPPGNPWAQQSVPQLTTHTQPACAWSPVSGSVQGPPLPSASLDAWAPANLAVS